MRRSEGYNRAIDTRGEVLGGLGEGACEGSRSRVEVEVTRGQVGDVEGTMLLMLAGVSSSPKVPSCRRWLEGSNFGFCVQDQDRKVFDWKSNSIPILRCYCRRTRCS